VIKLGEAEKALRDLGELSLIIENFYYYHLRRGLGNFYIFISATISVFLFLGLIVRDYLLDVVGLAAANMTIFLFILIAMIILFFMGAQYFKFLNLYKVRDSWEEKNITWLWVPISIGFIAYMIFAPSLGFPEYSYPLAVNIFVVAGNFVNYLNEAIREDYPGKVEKEYIFYIIILIIGAILIPIFPTFGWIITTISALAGAYAFGIYLVMTSERIFEEAARIGRRGDKKVS